MTKYAPRGEGHNRAKAPDQTIAAIRREYAAGGTTHRQLATKYGYSNSHISRLIRGLYRTVEKEKDN